MKRLTPKAVATPRLRTAALERALLECPVPKPHRHSRVQQMFTVSIEAIRELVNDTLGHMGPQVTWVIRSSMATRSVVLRVPPRSVAGCLVAPQSCVYFCVLSMGRVAVCSQLHSFVTSP